MPEDVRDIDGYNYKTIQIGNQIWMAESLRVSSFANGNLINEIEDGYQWQHVQMPAKCVYSNDPGYAEYGYLYNWYCVSGHANICPPGWRIPTLNDWKILADYYGGWNVAGIAFANPSGLYAKFGGCRTGAFEGMNEFVYFWTSDSIPDQPPLPLPGQTATAIYLQPNNPVVQIRQEYKIEGFYIRCIKQ